MDIVEALNSYNYPYFTNGFKKETFTLEKSEIDGQQVSYIVNFNSVDRFNLPFLLLDRATQSLGFQTCSYLLAQQEQLFRFLFLKRINWEFARPTRPYRPVLIEAEYNYVSETERKKQFAFSGTVNGNCAEFQIDIDVFLS